MAHINFNYVNDKNHPLLSFLSWITGVGYAISALLALSSVFYGSCFITGNKWEDFAIFIAVFVCCFVIQCLVFRSLKPKKIPTDNTPMPENKKQNTVFNTGHQQKKRFCKYCGHEIAPDTKKCTGCGKQYFTFKRLLRPAYLVLLIASVAANIVMGIMISDYKYKYEISYADLEDSKEKAESYREKAGYLDNHIAFTTNSGTKYHMYNCWHLNGNHDNMWTVEQVKRAGYEKCMDCH